MDVPWYYLAAIDLAEDILTEISGKIRWNCPSFDGDEKPGRPVRFLSSYNNSKSFHRKVERKQKSQGLLRG